MAEPHEVLNALAPGEAAAALRRACGAEGWVRRMLARRPFPSTAELLATADAEWSAATREECLEAFSHHPRIGEDLSALRERFKDTARLSLHEQAGVTTADEETLTRLRAANAAYRERFGYIFIIYASGKTAREMLAALEQRLGSDPGEELWTAAREQGKIAKNRLQGLGA